MTSKTCKNNDYNFFTKYLASRVTPANFLKSWLIYWFCYIEFLTTFTRIKRNCCNKINVLHRNKLSLHLCQGFSACLSILKWIVHSKMFYMAFEIFIMCWCQLWSLYNSFKFIGQKIWTKWKNYWRRLWMYKYNYKKQVLA